MKTYCCCCDIDKETGEVVSKEEQEPCSSHGYCKTCLEMTMEGVPFCRICNSFHDGDYEDSRYCSWNCHLIALEEK